MQHHTAVTLAMKSDWHWRQTAAQVYKLVLGCEVDSSYHLVD